MFAELLPVHEQGKPRSLNSRTHTTPTLLSSSSRLHVCAPSFSGPGLISVVGWNSGSYLAGSLVPAVCVEGLWDGIATIVMLALEHTQLETISSPLATVRTSDIISG